MIWQNFPVNTFPLKPINYKAVEGIVSNPSQSQGNSYLYEYFRNKYFYMYINIRDSNFEIYICVIYSNY